MWPRIVEVMLGIWLTVSPFIFRLEPQQTTVWIVDLLAGALVMIFALIAVWPRFSKVRLAVTGLGILLALWGYFQTRPIAAFHQNHIALGLLLVMLSIIPGQASLPPVPWRSAAMKKNERKN